MDERAKPDCLGASSQLDTGVIDAFCNSVTSLIVCGGDLSNGQLVESVYYLSCFHCVLTLIFLGRVPECISELVVSHHGFMIRSVCTGGRQILITPTC